MLKYWIILQRRMRNEGTVYQESSIQSEKELKDEREKYLAYYEEIISDMIENGVSEEEAVAHIRRDKKIAEEILPGKCS